MLLEFFDGLGIYLNYSYIDSNVIEFVLEDNLLLLGGLFKNVGSLILWYYKVGFDVKVFYNYCSVYMCVGSWDLMEIIIICGEVIVDVSIFYDVIDKFKIMLQG